MNPLGYQIQPPLSINNEISAPHPVSSEPIDLVPVILCILCVPQEFYIHLMCVCQILNFRDIQNPRTLFMVVVTTGTSTSLMLIVRLGSS